MQSRYKARLYHDLGQLLRAGFNLPRALEKLLPHARREAREALRQVGRVLENGGTAAEALAAPPAFAGLDAAIFAASDKAGRLERGLALAAEYHETLAAAWSRILVKSAYPLFIIHFAVLAFAVPKFLEGTDVFIWALISGYGALWGIGLALWLVWRFLMELGQRSAVVDRVMNGIPIFGKLRRAFALSRFCFAYDMQMEAGVNVFSALGISAAAAGGAAFAAVGRQATQWIREGEPLSMALKHTGMFPEPLISAMNVGESTGQLDAELRRAATEYRAAAVQRIELIVEWLPRVALIVVGAFIGVRMFDYISNLNNMQKTLGL